MKTLTVSYFYFAVFLHDVAFSDLPPWYFGQTIVPRVNSGYSNAGSGLHYSRSQRTRNGYPPIPTVITQNKIPYNTIQWSGFPFGVPTWSPPYEIGGVAADGRPRMGRFYDQPVSSALKVKPRPHSDNSIGYQIEGDSNENCICQSDEPSVDVNGTVNARGKRSIFSLDQARKFERGLKQQLNRQRSRGQDIQSKEVTGLIKDIIGPKFEVKRDGNYARGASALTGARNRNIAPTQSRGSSDIEHAFCDPELQTVQIPLTEADQREKETTGKDISYFPKCIRIKRCGGCCSHHLLSCQPTQFEMEELSVIRINSDDLVNQEVSVSMKKHTACECKCKKKPEDCNESQEYSESRCECYCANVNDQHACGYGPNAHMKFWNPDECKCQCKNVMRCSTNMKFDENTCQCIFNSGI